MSGLRGGPIVGEAACGEAGRRDREWRECGFEAVRGVGWVVIGPLTEDLHLVSRVQITRDFFRRPNEFGTTYIRFSVIDLHFAYIDLGGSRL